MRWLLVGLAGLTLAGCHKAPDASDHDSAAPSGSASSALAFSYAYTVRLPSEQISAAQEHLSQACEQLAPPRCRITGMSYNVDSDGIASASLDVAVASPIARRFGRDGVAAVEAAGGSLAGAQISGTDTLPDADRGADDAGRATADIARIDGQLARGDLTPEERAERTRQRAVADEARRGAADATEQARQAIATTPVSFRYQAGRGVGVSARIADAGQTAVSSLVWTLWIVLTLLAVLGPPVLLVLVAVLIWRRWLGGYWRRLWRLTDRTASAD